MKPNEKLDKELNEFDVNDVAYPGNSAVRKHILNGLMTVEKDGKDLNVKFDGKMLALMLQPYAKSVDDSFELLMTRYINNNQELFKDVPRRIF